MQILNIADGQVAATATAILASGPAQDGSYISATFTNVGGLQETLVITLSRRGGTQRRILRIVLGANEQVVVTGLPMNVDDALYAAASDAASVDYVVAQTPVVAGTPPQLAVTVFDANGAVKSGSAAVGSSSLSVAGDVSLTGDLTVTGGDVDAGASGAAGTVDVFPSTAAKGKNQYTATDNAGNTTNTITNAAMGQATTLTYADPLKSTGTIEPVQIAVVTLTSAQILALHNTPITVIASPGANKAIMIESVELRHAAGTAYASVGAGDDLSLKYTDGSGAQCFTTIETTGLLDQTGAQVRHYPGNTIGEVVPAANAVVCANLGGAVTTGDFDVLLRIRYRVVATNFS